MLNVQRAIFIVKVDGSPFLNGSISLYHYDKKIHFLLRKWIVWLSK